MHDVFSASRSGTHKDHSSKNRWPFLCHLLCNHPAERKTKHVTRRQAQAVQKRKNVLRHTGHGLRNVTAGSSHACVIEENDFAAIRERIGDGRIPIVQRPREVLQKQQGKARAYAKTTVSIPFVLRIEELRWRRSVATSFCRRAFVDALHSVAPFSPAHCAAGGHH